MGAIEDTVHKLIDVATGQHAILTAEQGQALHEEITPGYGQAPVSADEVAAAQAVLDRAAAEKADAEAPAADDEGDD